MSHFMLCSRNMNSTDFFFLYFYCTLYFFSRRCQCILRLLRIYNLIMIRYHRFFPLQSCFHCSSAAESKGRNRNLMENFVGLDLYFRLLICFLRISSFFFFFFIFYSLRTGITKKKVIKKTINKLTSSNK